MQYITIPHHRRSVDVKDRYEYTFVIINGISYPAKYGCAVIIGPSSLSISPWRMSARVPANFTGTGLVGVMFWTTPSWGSEDDNFWLSAITDRLDIKDNTNRISRQARNLVLKVQDVSSTRQTTLHMESLICDVYNEAPRELMAHWKFFVEEGHTATDDAYRAYIYFHWFAVAPGGRHKQHAAYYQSTFAVEANYGFTAHVWEVICRGNTRVLSELEVAVVNIDFRIQFYNEEGVGPKMVQPAIKQQIWPGIYTLNVSIKVAPEQLMWGNSYNLFTLYLGEKAISIVLKHTHYNLRDNVHYGSDNSLYLSSYDNTYTITLTEPVASYSWDFVTREASEKRFDGFINVDISLILTQSIFPDPRDSDDDTWIIV